MRVLLQLQLIVALAATAFAAEVEKTADVFAWPLSAAKSQPFAKVSYSYPSLNATVKSYSPLSLPDYHDLVRIGFYHSGDTWSGISTSSQSFGPGREKTLRLLVDSKGDVYHIGLTSLPDSTLGSQKTRKAPRTEEEDQLLVEVVRQTPGPTPHLNKPVVVNPDGKVDEQEPEKSFFQKYWMFIAGFIVLQLVMAGGGDK